MLTLIAHGLSNTEISATLVIAEQTTKTHVGRILAKLDLRDRAQAVVFAYETGLVTPGGSGATRATPPPGPISNRWPRRGSHPGPPVARCARTTASVRRPARWVSCRAPAKPAACAAATASAAWLR